MLYYLIVDSDPLVYIEVLFFRLFCLAAVWKNFFFFFYEEKEKIIFEFDFFMQVKQM